MIVFIAMVLVAGIVAYMILSTGSLLQIQSGSTGTQTIQEVSTGLRITTIQGHTSSGLIDKIVLIITPRAGSPAIDLTGVLMELSDSRQKTIIRYAAAFWVDGTSGGVNLFETEAFPMTSSEYGVIVLVDEDGSCLQNTPIINAGDSVILALNTTAIFSGIAENVNIEGTIIPEDGAGSIIRFRTPSAFVYPIVNLQ
jgi:archaeal flagellin FlaB